MPTADSTAGRLPSAFLTPGTSSFSDFLAAVAPEAAERARTAGATTPVPADLAPHGTTILAIETADGVVVAGDRRATAGNVVASRDIVKVHAADRYSAIGIAGVAGIGIEMIKLFQVELEHFEKLEGTTLSLEGKANRLATMIRGNLGLTMQGLAAVPLFAGYDQVEGRGRIFSFDVTGGRYAESDFHSIGSGSWFARGSLKKLWRRAMSTDEAVTVAVEALFDASEDDTATGGPDPVRRIWPVVAVVDARGYREIEEPVLASAVEDLLRRRTGSPSDSAGAAGAASTGGARS